MQLVTIISVHSRPHRSKILLERFVTATQAEDSVLAKDNLVAGMEMHTSAKTVQAMLNNKAYVSDNFCILTGATCTTYSPVPICGYLMVSVLKIWNYNLATLQADNGM